MGKTVLLKTKNEDTKKPRRANGEGSIQQRSDGKSWIARVTVTGADGKPKRISVSGKTRSDVVAKIQELQKSDCPDPTKVSTKEWLENWCESFAKAGRKQTTWESYEVQIRRHLVPGLGNIPLKDLTAVHIQKLLNEKLEKPRVSKNGKLGAPLSPYAVRYMYLVLSMALDQAKKLKMIGSNPCEDVEPPSFEFEKVKPLSAAGVAKFLESTKNSRLFPAFLLEWATGIRRGELLGLTWDCVDLEKGNITIKQNLVSTAKKGVMLTTPKTKASTRMLPIPPAVVKVLKEHKEKQDIKRKSFGLTWSGNFVFCTDGGKPLNPRNFTRDFGNAVRGAGLPPMRFHDMRHSFASMVLDKTGSLKVVQELLGQACFSVTADTYSHLMPRARKEALGAVSSVIPSWVGKK